MTPIYDPRGRVTAFLAAGSRIVSRGGRTIARVSGRGDVYDTRGRHRGWWRSGAVRGHDGGVMAFTRGACGMRVTPPIVGDPPLAPTESLAIGQGLPDPAPLMPPQRFAWSRHRL